MPRTKLISRIPARLLLLNALPITLITVPAAILANLWTFFQQASFYANASYVCVALIGLGISIAMLTLPELLRVTQKKMLSLLILVLLLAITLALAIAGIIEVAQRTNVQTMMMVLVILIGAIGSILVFRSGLIWTSK